MIVFDTNVKAKSATAQYLNFDYNSMVKFGDDFLCASEDGLFKVSGDSDNGEAITSYFEPGTTDFGISNEKKLRCFYISYEASGNLELTVSTELGFSETISIPASTPGQKARKETVSRSVRGRYFTFQIKGVGVDFSIDEIKVLPLIIGHGRDRN